MTNEGQAIVDRLCVVPDGKLAWLSYKQYRRLQKLFDAVDIPTTDPTLDSSYATLHYFLSVEAGLDIPPTQSHIHYNAFALMRRGYIKEELTATEYTQLRRLFDQATETDIDDMDLHAEGNHRALYNFLTRGLGLFVEAGRGPVWHRAKALLTQQ